MIAAATSADLGASSATGWRPSPQATRSRRDERTATPRRRRPRPRRSPTRHAGSKKVPVRSVITLAGRLTEPVSPSTDSSAPCQPSRPARVTTNEGIPKVVTMKPLKRPISGADGEAGEDRELGRKALLDGEHRHHRRGEAADGADREVDLAEQQDEHDADRDRRHGGDLKRQVGEVDRAQEAVVGELEDRPDDRDPEQHPDQGRARLGRLGAAPPRG